MVDEVTIDAALDFLDRELNSWGCSSEHILYSRNRHYDKLAQAFEELKALP